MRHWILLALLTITMAAILISSAASTQTGGGFDLSWNVVGGGAAGPMTGNGFSLRSTLGQTTGGLAGGPPFALCAGYWCGAGEAYHVYLPAMLKGL